MSFATLEEAWGVTSFAGPRPQRPLQSPAAPLADSRPQKPLARARQVRARVAAAATPEFINASEDVEFQNVQRALAQAYVRFGPRFVARLLPPEARHEIRQGGGGDRRRGGGFGAWARDVMRSPETVLFVLIGLFVALWAWDAFSSSSRQSATLASLHMSPFSLGSSA